MGGMLKAAPAGGEQLAYRGPNEIDARQRLLALGAVGLLHAVVVGGFIYAQLRPPPPPPEETLSISFITETAASAAPAPTPPQPPQPTPPPPEPQMLATPKPTLSPMTAPPIKPEPRPEAPKAAPPAPATPPANPSPSAASSTTTTTTRAAGDPGATTTTPPNFNAAYLSNPRPVYPSAARFRGYQGTTEMRVQVGADGTAIQVLISRSSGHKELDDAARDTVKKRWRFVPAKQGDRAIVGWVIVPLEFSLTKSR
jgi:protein TonB